MIFFGVLYVVLLGAMVTYGCHRYWLAYGCFWARRARARRRHAATERGPNLRAQPVESVDDGIARTLGIGGAGGSWPKVLVQLPLYNEGEVAARLIESAAALDYDRSALEIQVLDDSDDGSEHLVAREVSRWRQLGVPIEHLRRSTRAGYKAGALRAGLERTSAEFVAIFDADFVIPSDFLRRAIAPFADPRVGMVQTRWSYLNEGANLLTRVQAVLLDGHFAVEHCARAAAGRFFNFNGTAGVWRISAIEDAGGWRADTVTEDLDLSVRAWLRGWRFRYLDEVRVPSSLPEAMAAYKVQQNRWVSGSLQTAKQCLPKVWRSSLSRLDKLDLTLYLTGNLAYLLLFLMALAVPVAVLLRLDQSRAAFVFWADLPFFVFATLSVFVFYGAARQGRRPGRFFVLRLPLLMALGLGMSLHNTRAILRGLLGQSRVFDRTPKGGLHREARSARRRDPVAWLEPLMAIYLTLPALIVLRGWAILSVPSLALFIAGFVIVSWRAPTVRG
ncbi:MAG: glycosyltransferase [Planctomycetota bacterium]